MSTNTIEDPDYNILKRQFTNFFDKQVFKNNFHFHKKPFYTSEIRHLSEKGENRLILNINDIRSFDLDLANRLLSDPIKLIPPLEAVVLELSQTKSSSKKPKRPSNFKVGFEGSFGENMLIPRDIKSSFLTQLVCLEGIATKLTSVRPKRMETVHFCEQTKKFSSLLYGDGLSFDRPRTSATIPSKDSDGNPLQLEFGYSNFIDHQRIFVQDMPERSRAGQMPRNVEVVAENDLVDSCKAGDRVRITGVFRAVAWKASGNTNGLYRTVIIATNIKVVSQIMVDKPMTERDIKNIRRMSKKRDILDIFARSIASSLYGHEFVKKATVLLLLGGEEKNLENKTHIRGDINMLLMGDPSVGKSQLLRAIMQIAKLSISTTGKGSSGVGLTAAVLTDRETGERYLEAGATVLADRGVICIDEFDKMSEIDRTSIHEVMEQQTVTIAKAGIHTSLNARCSVVAAANPAYSSVFVCEEFG